MDQYTKPTTSRKSDPKTKPANPPADAPATSPVAASMVMAEQNRTPSEDVLAQAVAWLGAGKKLALVTVIETWGSSPRPVGSQMLVSENMDFAGSVSGGCVEGAVIEAAVTAISSNRHQILDFGISDLDAWQYGLACGGKMRALIMPLAEPFLERTNLAAILSARDRGEAQTILIDLARGQAQIFAANDNPPAHLSPEAQAGFIRSSTSDRSLLLDDQNFALNISPPPLLLIVGAVHIAQELSPMAKIAGFDPIIIDPRKGFATLHRFPNVKMMHQWPDEAMAELRLDRRAALVTMTHDPKLDDPALVAGLRLPLFYIGALGSKKTQASRVDRMKQAGFSEGEIARIHGPVGLPINALTAPEIAVAILAELIAARRRGG
ncbi:MAG: XdhC family protein [Candidatus Symbiobacter sp.]|nr:XdhC family protein [Candidatus Symbiobacter sp.]